MGDIGRRQVRLEVLPLAGGGRHDGHDVEDDAAWAVDPDRAGTDLADADTELQRRPGARAGSARS